MRKVHSASSSRESITKFYPRRYKKLKNFICLHCIVKYSLPGQWDTVFSKKNSDGSKERVAKQLMLVTLTELLVHQNPDNPISLSEFAKNRPSQCRWVWNKGRHRNCTCIVHENFKLLLEGTYSPKVGTKTEKLVGDLLCEQPQMDCWLGLCDKCPLEGKIDELFTEIDDGDEVSFYQIERICYN